MSDNRGGGWVQARQRGAPRQGNPPAPNPPVANPPVANPPVANPPVANNPAPVQGNPAPQQNNQPGGGWTRTAARPGGPRADGVLAPASQKFARGQFKPDEVDQLPAAQRRWTVNVQQALGIRGALGEGKILASAFATAERVTEGRRTAATVMNALPGIDPAGDTASALNQLATYETLPQKGAADRAMTLGMLTNAVQSEADPAAVAELEAQRSALRAEELLEEISGFGMPPWTQRQSQRAAAAKVELDLLSIPPGNRELQRFQGSAMATFWVNRSDGGGAAVKSFLCKAPSAGGEVEGIPPGGEVAREGMAALVASRLTGRSGLPMNVPVTHAVPVDNSFLPADTRNPQGGTVTCSVQEVRENRGDLGSVSMEDRGRLKPKECAALAMLDLVTLNTDRHHGNLLLGTDGSLVPIDHGACMPEDDGYSVDRIANSLGASRNILLSLPGTHEMLDAETRQRIAAMDPSAMASEQKFQRDAIEESTPAMRGKISDHAIDMSARSALFLKTAAAVEVGGQTLSPAAIQIAFANNARELLEPATPAAEDDDGNTTPAQGFRLDWNAFVARATEIARKALEDQPLTKAMCLMSNAEKGLLAGAIQAKGFSFGDVVGPPSRGLNNDPLGAALVLTSDVTLERNADQRQAIDAIKAGRRPSAEQAARRLSEVRLTLLETMLRSMPRSSVGVLLRELNDERDGLLADARRLAIFAEQAMLVVKAALQQQADEMRQMYHLTNNDFEWFNRRMARDQYDLALKELTDKEALLRRGANNG